MADPIAALRARRKELTDEQRKSFDDLVKSSSTPDEAWDKVSKVKWADSRETAVSRTGGALAQLGRAPIKVAEGALDIGSRAFGGAGTKAGLALAKARNRVQGVGDMLDAADPHGGVMGKVAEVSKLAGHAALAGLTGAGAGAVAGRVGAAVPGLAKAATALGEIGGTGWKARTAREGIRQALRTAPMTVALSGGDNGGLASSALGVKNKWGRAALDVAEDATFGSLTSALGARKAAKLAEQAKRAAETGGEAAAKAVAKKAPRKAAAKATAPVGDTGDMPLVTPPKAKEMTRAEKKAANRAKLDQQNAEREAARLKAKAEAPPKAKKAAAPVAEPAPKTEAPPKAAPKAAAPDTPEVRAAKERLDAAEAERMAAKDDRLANGDNAARRARIRAAESEVKSAAWAHENAVKNAERKAAKAAAPKAEPKAAKAEAPKATAEPVAEAPAKSEAGAWKDDPTDPRHGMTKAERKAYNQAEFAKQKAAAEAAAPKKKAPKTEAGYDEAADRAQQEREFAQHEAEHEAKLEASYKAGKRKPWKYDPEDGPRSEYLAEEAKRQREWDKGYKKWQRAQGRPMRPGDVIGDGEAKLSPRTQAALDAEAETERLKDSIGKPAQEPTKPNTANLNEKEKAELKRLKKVAPKAPKADKTLLSKMPDEELTALRSKLLREQETKMGAERPARGSWEAVDAEWQARKQRRAATKKSNAEAVDAERKAAKAKPEVERPPLAPKGTVRKGGKVLTKKDRPSFSEGDGAQEASPVAKAVARGADEDEVTWRMRLHEQEAAKVRAAEAEVVRVRADRKATLAQTRAAQAALADARAAEKQAQLAAQRAARGWGEPRKGQPVQHSSLAVAEDRAKLAASQTELERLASEAKAANAAADAKPKDKTLTLAAIAANKAYRAALSIAKREGMKAGTGAVIGGALAGAEDASAQGEGGSDTTGLAERIGTGMLMGAGLAVGGASLAKRFRGGATRNISAAAKRVLTEEDRLALLPAEKRAAARAAAKAGNSPMAPVGQRTHLGPAYVDPNMPHPALGGKAPRDLFNVEREGFKDLSAESKARLSTLLIEQLPKAGKESVAATKRAAAKIMGQLPADVLAGIKPSEATRAQTVAAATYMLELHKAIDEDMVKLNSGTLGGKARALLREVIDRKTGEEVRLARMLQASGTETARDLNAFKLIANVTSPGMFVVRMEKLLGRELEMHEAQHMRDLLAANNREEAIKYAMSLNKPGWLKKIVHLRNTGLLAGIPGRVKDVASSLSHMGLETVVQPVAAGIDRVAGRITARTMREAGMGQRGALRSVTAPTVAQVLDIGKGIGTGAKEFVNETLGAKVWRKALPGNRIAAWAEEMRRTKLTADQLLARDLPTDISFEHKGVDTYAKFVQRVTAGVDNIAKSGALEGEKHNMARILAAQDVADGTITAAEQAAKVAEYMRTPTAEMEEAMHQFAVSITFQNKGVAATMARVLKRELPRAVGQLHPALGEAMGALVNMAVPFATTGANIGARLIDYTPLGGVRGAKMMQLLQKDIAQGKQLTTALIRARQRDAVEAVGRSFVGTGVLLGSAGVGYNMYKEGLLTGQSSKDGSQRETDEAAGRQPNSLNVGGYWIPIGQYSPVGNLLTVGATIARGVDEGTIEEPRSLVDFQRLVTAAWTAELTAMRSVVEQPLVTGVKTAIDVASDPVNQATGYLGQVAGSFVPTFVNDLAYATDRGRARMVDKTTLSGNIGGNIARRIPGLRTLLPKDYDALGGEVRPRRGGMLGAVLPVSGMKDRAGNPETPEAQALWAAGGGLRLPRREKGESLHDYSERTRIIGEEVRRAMRERLGGSQVEWPRDVTGREELQDWVRETASIGRRRAQLRLREAGLLVPRK